MGIAALALDRYVDNTYSVAGKENYTGVDETSKSFGSHLSEARSIGQISKGGMESEQLQRI